MVRIVPVPRHAPLVIVPADPYQAPDVLFHHPANNLIPRLGSGAHLRRVIATLPSLLAKTHGIVIHLVDLISLVFHHRLELLQERVRLERSLELHLVAVVAFCLCSRLGLGRLLQLVPKLCGIRVGDVRRTLILGAFGGRLLLGIWALRAFQPRRLTQELRAKRVGGAHVGFLVGGFGRPGRLGGGRCRRRDTSAPHRLEAREHFGRRPRCAVGGVDGPADALPGVGLVGESARVPRAASELEVAAGLLAHLLVSLTARALALLCARALLEDGFFVLPHRGDESLDASEVGFTVAAEVTAQTWELLSVDGHDEIDGALANLERRRVRQEIVPHEETHEDEIVEQPLDVEREGELDVVATRGDGAEIQREILSEHRHGEKLVGFPRDGGFVLGHLPQDLVARARDVRFRSILLKHHLAKDPKVGLVRGEREHDEIRVEAVHHVLGVWVEPLLSSLLTDVMHRLVLALAGNGGIGHDHFDATPPGVGVKPEMHVVLQRGGESPHERRAGRDDVTVKRLRLDLVGHLDALLTELLAELFLLLRFFLRLLRGTETTRALLVHLRAGGDAVDGHVQQLSRAHHSEEAIDVVKDALEHLLLGGGRGLQAARKRRGRTGFVSEGESRGGDSRGGAGTRRVRGE